LARIATPGRGRLMKRRKRFAIVIGVAAVGMMALGAQTGAAATGVVEYGTKLTIFQDGTSLHGEVKSKVRQCWEGREVIVFRKRPGPDRKLGATRSGPAARSHNWSVNVKVGKEKPRTPQLGRVYAKATPKVGDGFVCLPGSSGVCTWPDCAEGCPHCDSRGHSEPALSTRAALMALGAQTALAGGESVDSTPPDLQLSGPKKQSPQNAKPEPGASHCPRSLACYLKVRMSCGDEACTVLATGKLTNVKRDKLFPTACLCPQAGGTFNLGPELAWEAQRREVRQALANGENVKAKVTVKAKDAAGNVATAKRTITLVK
jgi:hypothetical protein